ncbi:oligoendopeptidase F [Gracilibacillus caseinilyticus]|uniref:Oligopeptidase F n=1 Tax=Gracilibacillus caseinilyticus TaxID=2932256 RepID=A0ABY4EVE5_9BACI|nr:oligoendopeptidase F [Gracilibacillus caseinilyticus]UOQ48368.1 oligoendopeptidase F [Gracilibacillus caseinilyticus]
MSKTKRLHRSEVPFEQTWDLTDLFPNQEAWEMELKAIQMDIAHVTAFKGNLVTSASNLLDGLTTYENYLKRVGKVSTYAELRITTDGSDPENQRDAAKVSSAMATINAQLSFIQSELLTLYEEQAAQFLLEEEELATYKKLLDDILEQKPYTLAPDIEETLAALGEVHDAPFMIYERSTSSDMAFASIKDEDGNDLPMSAALYEDLYELEANTSIRRNAYQSFIHTLNQYKHTYAATYATEVTKQVTLARLKKYDSVTDMLLFPQQVTKEMYHNQLDVSQQELAPHMQRYAKLLKEKLGLADLQFADLKAPLDPEFNPSTTYDETKSLILDALQVMGPEYSDIIQKGLHERWIDLADNIGKQSGAFCATPYGVHPYILITWTGAMRGAFVLAHELGHAGHFYLAGKNQSLVNSEPSTYFVEAPSTINELLLANHLQSTTTDKRMKRWVVTQLLGTYYHNFVTHLLEGEFQRRIYELAEAGTPLTADVLNEQKLAVLKNFWGETVSLDEGAGLTWMRQPHYYMGLYPYTYSAGLTVATAVAKQIQTDGKPAADNWLDVLKAGGTLKPLDLIHKAGVDMSKPDAIKETIAYIGSLVDALEESYQ